MPPIKLCPLLLVLSAATAGAAPSRQARLRVEASVPWAQVSIDGQPAGEVPVERTLRPGKHRYEVTTARYLVERGQVELRPGERTIIQVRMRRRYRPLGLILLTSALLSVPLRFDTPFNNGVNDDETFDMGVGVTSGASLKLLYSFTRLWGLRVGLGLEYVARPLNTFALGPTVDWCPAAVRPWCPVNLGGYLPVVKGEVRQFRGGELSFRVGSRVEPRFRRFLFSLGASLTVETYSRQLMVSLGLMTLMIEAGVGVDL